MRTANPALSADTFSGLYVRDRAEAMTEQGTINKTGLLFLLMLLTAGWTWSQFYVSKDAAALAPWMYGGAIVGFVVALVTVFKKEWSPILAPVYALCQGFFIGGLSATIDAAYPGIVIQATSLTFGTLAIMLFLYKFEIIRVTDKFRMGIVMATGAVALVYLVTIGLSFFGVSVPFVQGSGVASIIFSLVVVGIASLNLILDFDVIEQGVARGLPRYMEWYGAFALMVTLIWLYVEILRLLAKMRER